MNPSLAALVQLKTCVLEEVAKTVVGQQAGLEAMLVAFFSQGHALLEGVPGTGKTLMVRSFAHALGLGFGRIQFTPDLMPNDILGTHIYDTNSASFRLERGPIFHELILADELNRAPPKTQSALLEAMQERQVTLDGRLLPLPAYFTVFATQNPVEQEGTYPLPEAELDRFLVRAQIAYPSAEEEDALLFRSDVSVTSQPSGRSPSPVVGAAELDAARHAARHVHVSDGVRHYVRDLVRATRTSPHIRLGAGPRAGVHLLVAARWAAALDGAAYLTPDHVVSWLVPVLAHRLVLASDAELEGISAEDVLQDVMRGVDVPR